LLEAGIASKKPAVYHLSVRQLSCRFPLKLSSMSSGAIASLLSVAPVMILEEPYQRRYPPNAALKFESAWLVP
jgi:hypothetical protein